MLLSAHENLGESWFWLGELSLAHAQFAQALALADPQQPRYPWAWIDLVAACRSYMAWTLWLLGYPDQALTRSQEALTRAQELAHPFTLAFALDHVAMLHQHRREGPAVHKLAEAQVTLATEQGFPNWLAWGTIFRGWALAEQGQGEEGIVQIRQGMAACRAAGAEIAWPYILALLAEVHGKVGQVEEGLSVLAEALATADKTEGRHYEAELYRLKGELLLAQADKLRD
ncbi:MAG: hypothetical protein HY267_02090 [Deltaproteobacteria bacterium]|nr:hypothetical protein [Deltaproteobacteria bacterium]